MTRVLTLSHRYSGPRASVLEVYDRSNGSSRHHRYGRHGPVVIPVTCVDSRRRRTCFCVQHIQRQEGISRVPSEHHGSTGYWPASPTARVQRGNSRSHVHTYGCWFDYHGSLCAPQCSMDDKAYEQNVIRGLPPGRIVTAIAPGNVYYPAR
jgi:hypothetical protein